MVPRRLRLIDTQKGFPGCCRTAYTHYYLPQILPPFLRHPTNRPTKMRARSFFPGYSSNLKFELVNSRCNPKQVGNPSGGISEQPAAAVCTLVYACTYVKPASLLIPFSVALIRKMDLPVCAPEQRFQLVQPSSVSSLISSPPSRPLFNLRPSFVRSILC